MSFKSGQAVVHTTSGKEYEFSAGAGRGKAQVLDSNGGTVTLPTKELMHKTAWEDKLAKEARKAEKAKSKPAKPAKAEKPAKAPKAPKAPKAKAESGEAVVSGALTYDPNKYVRHDERTPSGSKVRDINDPVADKLRGLELDKMYSILSKEIGETAKSLKEKYGHLNHGMQRMTIGNRLRALSRAAIG